MKKSLKKTKDEERKKEIGKVIQRIANQEQSEKQRSEKRKLKNQLIEEKKAMLNSDSKPVYVNKGKREIRFGQLKSFAFGLFQTSNLIISHFNR